MKYLFGMLLGVRVRGVKPVAGSISIEEIPNPNRNFRVHAQSEPISVIGEFILSIIAHGRGKK